ncbi:hypothetical protein GCM10007049_18330 [Echinicola pacifica]|uniref:Uncharacterized protein n=2 Tax=Echinicola pacifica TaxID=346377 RepID=A0A918UQ72_9BACT|nr:hypothetical protein GCM10007049_18330 [Echinicola pacifica]
MGFSPSTGKYTKVIGDKIQGEILRIFNDLIQNNFGNILAFRRVINDYMNMKKLLIILSMAIAIGAMSSCTVFNKTPTYKVGMDEKDFLKMNPTAVISNLEGPQKTYRVVRDDKFYLLATFEDEQLIRLEEKELPAYWNQNNFQQQEEKKDKPIY